MQKRELNCQSGTEVIADIENLRTNGYQKLGNWNLSQICEHITKTLRVGMDGSDFRLPWILRKTVGPWVIGRMLKTGKLPFRLSAPKQLRPDPEIGDEQPELIDSCIATLQEAEQFPGPLPPYPLKDNVNVAEWKQIMWVHACHHLAFLIPNDGN